MSIVLQGSISGSITLQEPAVAGSNTINLPASTGTMALLQTPSFATTIGVGGATPSTSGAGITFPATQSASSDANTLDDYEEGSWTPTLVASGYTFSYGSRSATYTKNGNLVTFKLYMSKTTTTGSGTVALYIGGLPFSSSANNFNYGGTSMCPDGGSSWFTNVPNFRTEPNSTQLILVTGFNGASATASFNIATMPNPTEFEISGFYYV